MPRHRKLRIEELDRLSPEQYRSAAKRPLVVVLDDIRSGHNVGAIFRTSDAFLLEKVYLCGITPAPPHKEIRKSAIGAEETMAWERRQDAQALVEELATRGYRILSVEQTESSTPLGSFRLPEPHPLAVVLGHEITGVKQRLIDRSDDVLEIPQHGTKHSLNVSVAAGIVLFHLAEQLPLD